MADETPDIQKAKELLAEAHKAYEAEEYDRAIELCSACLDSLKDNTSQEADQLRASAHNGQGAAYNEKGEQDRALQNYNKAISIKPDKANYYYNRGNALSDKGEHDRAIQDYNKAISINPDDPDYYSNRGNAYSRKGDYDRAIQDYDKAINIDKAHSSAHRGYAFALAQRESQASVAAFQKEMKEQLEKQKAELESQMERQLEEVTNPEKIAAEYELQGKLIREFLDGRKKWLLIYTWLVQIILWTGFGGIIFLIGYVTREGIEISTPTALTAYLLLGGFFISCYALITELRRRRTELLHNVAESHDNFRKQIFARYPILFPDDKEKRFEVTRKFIDHMSEKSPAEFVLNWRDKKGKNENSDDAPITRGELRKIIAQVVEEMSKSSGG